MIKLLYEKIKDKRKKLACGRTEKDWANYCSNPDYTWRTNKLILTKVQFFWRKGSHIKIHYKIRWKKCRHIRQSGNCFG